MPFWWLASGDQRRLTGNGSALFMTMRYTNGRVYFPFFTLVVILRSLVLTHYQRVMDGRTDVDMLRCQRDKKSN